MVLDNHNHNPIAGMYPVASETVAKMLKIKTAYPDPADLEIHPINQDHEEIPVADLPVRDLPIAEKKFDIPKAQLGLSASEEKQPGETAEQQSSSRKGWKAVLPYILIFLVGLTAYYFFFSNTTLNLSGIFKVKPKTIAAPLTVKDTALMQLQKDSAIMKSYQIWITQFYFDVSDLAVFDPNADNSGNGLNNFQKFLLNLNPKVYDTLGTGLADSQAIAQGINPLTGGKLTAGQKDVVEKYFDLETISNRLTVEILRRNGLVAGSSIKTREAARSENVSASPKSGLGNNRAGGYDNPVNPEVNSDELNLDIPGRLEIPALSINVPLIFSRDPKNFEKDLQLGVVHYPGTALPGQIGTSYISGHSSNYFWAKGNYNQVFSKLGDLPDNSSFVITVVQKNGKDARFHYVVTHRKEFSPTDQEQFRNTGESVVTLSTCWPVGSTKSRLVIFGKLTQVEK